MNDLDNQPAREGLSARAEAEALRALYVVSRDGLVVEDRVGVCLSDGTMTLHGTVDTTGQRYAAEAYVRGFNTVVEVSNRILVRTEPRPQAA